MISEQLEINLRQLIDNIYQPLMIFDPLSGIIELFLGQKNRLSLVVVAVRKIMVRPVANRFFGVLATAVGIAANL